MKVQVVEQKEEPKVQKPVVKEERVVRKPSNLITKKELIQKLIGK